jgi:hypothetical protein
MRLYCSRCGATHYFRNSQVERLIYGLQARQFGFGVCLGDMVRETEDEAYLYALIEHKVFNRRSARSKAP